MSSLSDTELDVLVAEAVVDCYDEHERLGGLFTMIENNLAVPFGTEVLGALVRPHDDLPREPASRGSHGDHTCRVPIVMGMAEHLMGAGEVRDRLGRLSRQRVYQITTDPSFPKPYDELQMGKVWRIEDVEAWIARRQDGVRRISETRETVVEGR